MSQLRPHQDKGLRVFRAAMAEDRTKPIVFYVTMGGGKTRMYAECAAEAWRRKSIRTIVYVPSIVIAKGVKRAMLEVGLKPTMLNRNKAEAFWDSDRNVVISTYAKLAVAPEVHRDRVGAASTLVVCDEIHHAGTAFDDSGTANRYGYGVERVYEKAVHTIYGTGTPYRSDSRILPDVDYEEPYVGDDGKARQQIKADVTLTVGDAIGRYTREVTFAGYDEGRIATLLNRSTREYEQKDFSTVRDGLSRIVEDRDNWAPVLESVIGLMHDRSLGLVIANNICHAQRIHAFCEASFGRLNPMMVTSDDAAAADELEVFRTRKTRSRLLITVGMAAEGFDCPQLTHLAYLSANRTELALDQAIGRVIRMTEEEPTNAFAAGLGDAKWNDYVENYKLIRSLEQKKREEREQKERDGSDQEPLPGYLGSSGTEDMRYQVDGHDVKPELFRVALKHGIDAAKFVSAMEDYLRGDEDPVPEDENSDEARKKEGRRVFGKGGVIPKLNYSLVGKADASFLVKATSKLYHQLHGKPGNKPYPVEVTLEFERIALMLAKTESQRPSWFNERLRHANR